jgi:hypothetical protein
MDIMNFITPCTLAQFVKDFGTNGEESKSVFVYESFNTSNYNEILDVEEPFTKQDFHSHLKNRDISDTDYENYITDWKNKQFKNRWDYLKYYNINDVAIMVNPIDELIKKTFIYKVDLLKTVSLAGVAAAIKFYY